MKEQKTKVRFYTDDSEKSNRIEQRLKDKGIEFIKIIGKEMISDEITLPAVEYRGYFYEGEAEICFCLQS